MTKRRVGKKYTIQQFDKFQIDIDHSLMTDFLSLGIQQMMLLNIVSEDIQFFYKNICMHHISFPICFQPDNYQGAGCTNT